MRLVTPMAHLFLAALDDAGAVAQMEDDGSLVVTGLSASQIGEMASDPHSSLSTSSRHWRGSLEGAFMELTRDAVEFRTFPHTRIESEPKEMVMTNLTTQHLTHAGGEAHGLRDAGAGRRMGLRDAGDYPTPGGYGVRQAVRAEVTKLGSVRSTTWTLLATVVGTLLLTVLATAHIHQSRRSFGGFDPANAVR